MNLTCDRWLPRLLHWKPIGQRRAGRPRQQWDDMLRMFCRYKRLGEWEVAAQDGCNWETLMPQFINFCSGSEDRHLRGNTSFYVQATLFHLCLSWAAFGHTGFTHSLTHSGIQVSFTHSLTYENVSRHLIHYKIF